MIRILSEADVTGLLDSSLAFDAAEEAFRLASSGAAENGGRQRVEKGSATLNLMAAIAPGLGVMGAKVYPVVRSDVSQGASFTYQLYDYTTGALLAILSANALGNKRTAAATAVATRTLARGDSEVLTVVGAGWVAMAQTVAVLETVPGIRLVNVIGRDRDRLADFVDRARHQSRGREGLVIVGATDAKSAVESADIIVTATGSSEPVFDGTWITPGTHVNAVGSNYRSKRELDDAAIDRADLVVVDALDVARSECGDLLQHTGGVPDAAIELGSVLLGERDGRTSESQVTLFESQGMAILDLVSANAVILRAAANGTGFELEYDLEAW